MSKKMFTLIAVFILTAWSASFVFGYSYALLNGADGYSYDSGGRLEVNWKYTQNGTKNYSYRIGQAASTWDSHIGFFDEVSSGENTTIESDDWGDVGYVGRAYYTRSPLEFRLNEWYHINYSNYGYTEYQRTSLHEWGHLLGLAHVSNYDEVMNNATGKNISQTWLGDGDKAGINNKY